MSWQPDCSEDYKQQVLRARAMSPEEKLLAGERLFAEKCERIKAEIRMAIPGLSEEQILQELISTLNRQREEEERGIYIRIPQPQETHT